MTVFTLNNCSKLNNPKNINIDNSYNASTYHNSTQLKKIYSNTSPSNIAGNHEIHTELYSCNECHSGYRTNEQHKNGIIENTKVTAFKSNTIINENDKSCTNVSCHGNSNITLAWYGEAECLSCHNYSVNTRRDIGNEFPGGTIHGHLTTTVPVRYAMIIQDIGMVLLNYMIQMEEITIFLVTGKT